MCEVCQNIWGLGTISPFFSRKVTHRNGSYGALRSASRSRISLKCFDEGSTHGYASEPAHKSSLGLAVQGSIHGLSRQHQRQTGLLWAGMAMLKQTKTVVAAMHKRFSEVDLAVEKAEQAKGNVEARMKTAADKGQHNVLEGIETEVGKTVAVRDKSYTEPCSTPEMRPRWGSNVISKNIPNRLGFKLIEKKVVSS